MSPAAAAAALALAAAAPLSELGRVAARRRLDHGGRALAAGAGVLLLFAAARPAARPAAVLAFAAAGVFPRGLPCLMATATAVVAAMRPASEPSTAGLGAWILVAALALGLAAAAFQEAAETSGPSPRVASGAAAAVAGALLVLTLMAADGGRILHWRYGLGAGAARLELPGAALVLGLALLVSLAGSLSMGAHLLAHSPEPSRAGRMGQSLLVLGAGLGVLGVAVVAGQGLGRNEVALAAGAVDVAAMLLALGLMMLALVQRLAGPIRPGDGLTGDAPAPRSGPTLRLAAAAALVAAVAAGVEGWRADGTYATATLAEAAAVALLGLAAVQPTRLGLARTALFTFALLAALARAL